jgi:hypothetical protein
MQTVAEMEKKNDTGLGTPCLLDFEKTLAEQPEEVKKKLKPFIEPFLRKVQGYDVDAQYAASTLHGEKNGALVLIYTAKELSKVTSEELLEVKEVLEKLGKELVSFKELYWRQTTGEKFFDDLAIDRHSFQRASLDLLDLGISGYVGKVWDREQGASKESFIWNKEELETAEKEKKMPKEFSIGETVVFRLNKNITETVTGKLVGIDEKMVILQVKVESGGKPFGNFKFLFLRSEGEIESVKPSEQKREKEAVLPPRESDMGMDR